MNEKYTVRQRGDGLTSGVEDAVSVEKWPYAIDGPEPPYGFGAVVALAHNEKHAQMIADALNGADSALTAAATRVMESAGMSHCRCGLGITIKPELHRSDCRRFIASMCAAIIKGEDGK